MLSQTLSSKSLKWAQRNFPTSTHTCENSLLVSSNNKQNTFWVKRRVFKYQQRLIIGYRYIYTETNTDNQYVLYMVLQRELLDIIFSIYITNVRTAERKRLRLFTGLDTQPTQLRSVIAWRSEVTVISLLAPLQQARCTSQLPKPSLSRLLHKVAAKSQNCSSIFNENKYFFLCSSISKHLR